MQQDVPLKDYTTMRLGGTTRFLATAHTVDELFTLITQAEQQSIPLLVLGDGSNMIVGNKGFSGITILNRIPGFEILREDTKSVIVKVGSGESWDTTVKRTVDMGLSGIESLSGIPGRVGSAPIQNIGAYGQEIADTLLGLEAYDTLSKKKVRLANTDCDFTYRQSIFNSVAKHRYVILSITLELSRQQPEPPFYDSLQKYFDTHGITDYSPSSVRQAVLALRSVKLPDPAVIANAGSFFKNPIVEKWLAESLKKDDPTAPVFDMGEGLFKISAGWLIENAYLKGYQVGGIKIYEKNALVLVNTGDGTYDDLIAVREHIIDVVRDTFRINLIQEPEELGV